MTAIPAPAQYNNFTTILEREYGNVFGAAGAKKLQGENVDLCLPNFRVQVQNVTDFSMCA